MKYKRNTETGDVFAADAFGEYFDNHVNTTKAKYLEYIDNSNHSEETKEYLRGRVNGL